MWLFCQLLQTEGYLSPPAVPPSCHTLQCSTLSWHPGAQLPLPAIICLRVCVLHICQSMRLKIISMEMSKFRLCMRREPIWEPLRALSLHLQDSFTLISPASNLKSFVFFCLLINQVSLCMMKVSFSRQSWNLTAVISQWDAMCLL